ncbi:MAG: DNA oxidative demethylase AlkB [Ilumatobacteraceae bacterium]
MLFPDDEAVTIGPGAILLRGAVESLADELLRGIKEVITRSPLRRVVTPMGKPMSVEMTNCGDVGWVSDKSGYRYEKVDPLTGCAWPVMPTCFGEVAQACALQAGYEEFHPDACLINRYSAGSRMGLHQDRDERDFSQPIVSVSLGLPITFVFGGTVRTATKSRLQLQHGDVVVFGGESRLAFHGVGTLRPGEHPSTGNYRFNLTFRRTC